MKVVALDEYSEKRFWDYVNKDQPNCYFFILDWKLRRNQTKILMVIEDDEIEGLMLVYRDYVVQLRGGRAAVKLLLHKLDLEKVELQAPLDCEDLVLEKFSRPKIKQIMILMCLRKGDENIQMASVPARLTVDDAEEVVGLLRRADPSWWGICRLRTCKDPCKRGSGWG